MFLVTVANYTPHPWSHRYEDVRNALTVSPINDFSTQRATDRPLVSRVWIILHRSPPVPTIYQHVLLWVFETSHFTTPCS